MKAPLFQAAVLIALSAAAAGLTYHFHPKAPALHLYEAPAAEGEVTLAQARQWEAEGGVLWIDARARAQYDKEHVPGALLLNEEEWDTLMLERINDLMGNQRPVVIYCDAQQCDASHRLAQKLTDLGIPQIHVLAGGWPAWKSANQ